MRIRLLRLYIVLIGQVRAQPEESGGVQCMLGVSATEVDIQAGDYRSIFVHMSLPDCRLNFGSCLQATINLGTYPVMGWMP